LLESRGAYEKIEQKRHVDNLVLKLRGWQKLDSADPINGLKKKPRDMSKLRKINPDLVREAILAIGSSAPRKGYKAYYDYYLELEREKTLTSNIALIISYCGVISSLERIGSYKSI
ncbi:hypothetical protein, partial [Helicobacter suis]|uniref:hypothetical protein n=1 Tax=Helicobacter suis TaxID=104628 RepID=UPI0013D6F8FC